MLFIIYFPNTGRDTGKRQIDYLGMVLLIATVVPLLIGLSWGTTEYGWASVQFLGFLAFALAAGTLFVVVERRVAEPIMPFSIYRNRTVTLALLAIFLTGFGMFGGIIFVPLFFQGVLGGLGHQQRRLLDPDDARDGLRSSGFRPDSVPAGRALSPARAARDRDHGRRDRPRLAHDR